ncbi:MAG: hypothetical protein NTV58_03855 [Deltaproteobacteria bacterium]|nr:hypothetical protein [Deltaproteobacteria bacterium]
MDAATWIIAIASIVTAVATVAIWRNAMASNRLSEEIKKASEQTHEEYNKLLMFLTTATLVSGRFGDNPQDSIDIFKERHRMLRDALKDGI